MDEKRKSGWRPGSGREDEIQRAVAQLCDGLGLLWWHTPNGGRRGKVEAARFKGLGVKSGVPDVIVVDPCPLDPFDTAHATPEYEELERLRVGCRAPDGTISSVGLEAWLRERRRRGLSSMAPACAIELKAEYGRVQSSQERMIGELRARGWFARVTYGSVQPIDLIVLLYSPGAVWRAQRWGAGA